MSRKIKDIKDKHTGELVYPRTHVSAVVLSSDSTLEDLIEVKQDKINDLDEIRAGAAKGATALQSVPSEYVTETELSNKGYATISALNNKVDAINGKQLSTEDFTTALKTKLEGLSNYDDTELSDAISTLRGDFDNIVSGDTTTAIKTFNEVIAFLDGLTDTQDLESIIASIEQQIVGKMDKVTLATVATSGSYNDLSNKPTIPAAVTESTVSGWGFTKNAGTYSKPSGGIPKSDLASAVQTSLGKADTALQSYTEQYKGTITGVSANGTSVATSGVANIPAASTSAYGVTKLSSATNSTSTTLAATASAVKAAYDLANSYKGTVTGVKINGTTKNPSSGVVDLGNVITEHQNISHLAEKTEIPTKISDLDGSENLLETTNIKTINGENIVKGADEAADIKTQLAYAEYTDTATAVVVNTKYGYFPTTLVEGASVAVKFEGSLTYITTLNVNGTGAKNVYYKGNSLTSGAISRYNTYLFVYDGSYYRIVGIDTDTHHTAKNVVTSSSTAKSNATATNGNVYLNAVENSTVRSTHKIVGTGATAVTSDSSGNITIDTPIKTINGESIIGSGNITISGGSSDANVQAVDTGDVLDDVTVNYATKTYVDGLVGDINSVLESIINGGVSLITFTIADTEYHAENGMTWEDWVNSEYNTSNYLIEDDLVYTMSNWIIEYIDNVTYSDIILNNGVYVLTDGMSGGGSAE